jgi:hypothetical protein
VRAGPPTARAGSAVCRRAGAGPAVDSGVRAMILTSGRLTGLSCAHILSGAIKPAKQITLSNPRGIMRSGDKLARGANPTSPRIRKRYPEPTPVSRIRSSQALAAPPLMRTSELKGPWQHCDSSADLDLKFPHALAAQPVGTSNPPYQPTFGYRPRRVPFNSPDSHRNICNVTVETHIRE